MSAYNRHPNFFVRLFTHDILRKVIALFFACLLAYTISTRNGSTKQISSVPVEIEVPPGLILIDDEIPTVSLRVRGGSKEIDKLSGAELRGHAKVLAANYTPGKAYSLRLSPSDFPKIFGVSVLSIDPAELPLNIEEVTTAKVPVEPRFDSLRKLPPDYAVSKVKFTPAEVQISGPKSTVASLTGIQTQPIPLDKNSTYSFDYNAEIGVPPGIVVSPSKVVAAVEIERSFSSRTFDSIPLTFLFGSGKAPKVELLTAPNVEVKLAGPRGVMATFKPAQIHAYCDISKLKDSGSYTVDVGCYIDRGGEISLVNVYPDKVKIKLTR